VTHFGRTPLAAIRSVTHHRQVLFDLARRDAVGRYKGSFLGVVWSLLTPLVMLAVYTFVFGSIFRARWGAGGDTSQTQFAVVLFAGLIMFNIFAEATNRAPGLLLANQNFVKKVVFPLELLPCVNLLSALFHALISILVLLAFELIVTGSLPWTLALIPLVLLPLCMFTLGVTWFLSATGVYLRDIGQTIGILVTALMFLSPIFFPASSIPERWRSFASLNPLAFPIEESRAVLVFGHGIDPISWTIYTVCSIFIAWAGFAWFQTVRKGFADVL
jgi:lipopolysaccharide transport system permease protein